MREKVNFYCRASGNNQYIYLINDGVQLFIIVRKSKLLFNFSPVMRDFLDFLQNPPISLTAMVITQTVVPGDARK